MSLPSSLKPLPTRLVHRSSASIAFNAWTGYPGLHRRRRGQNPSIVDDVSWMTHKRGTGSKVVGDDEERGSFEINVGSGPRFVGIVSDLSTFTIVRTNLLRKIRLIAFSVYLRWLTALERVESRLYVQK